MPDSTGFMKMSHGFTSVSVVVHGKWMNIKQTMVKLVTAELWLVSANYG